MNPKAHPGEPSRVVLDTNVVLDWLVFEDPTAAGLAACVSAGLLRWMTCRRMREELCDVLTRPRFTAVREARERALTSFDRLSLCVEAGFPTAPTGLRCTDADDQMFVDLALGQGARWLFTRDKALLALAPSARRCGLEIVSPAHWRAADHLSAP